MDPITRDRLFGYWHAFDHPVSACVSIAVAAIVILAFIGVLVATGAGGDEGRRKELRQRTVSWLVLAPLIVVPILLGAAWTVGAVGLLSLLCYREYARASGLFREKLVSLIVVLGILAVTFAVIDHWYGLFMALGPLTIAVMAAVSILPDRPEGYVQRVALGVFAFAMFGVGLGHLGYMANDADFRPILLMLLVSVEMNDVFAYLVGRTIGRRRLCPRTSPNKTLGGALGAVVLTTPLVAILGHFVFAGGPMDRIHHLVALGLIISVGGQLGDLMLSSIKRDIGIKDTGVTIPGHGGLLDRFDSLLLVAPAVFHYIGYLRGIGLDQPARIITG